MRGGEEAGAEESHLLKTVGWISAALGAVALGLIVGRELRGAVQVQPAHTVRYVRATLAMSCPKPTAASASSCWSLNWRAAPVDCGLGCEQLGAPGLEHLTRQLIYDSHR